MGSELNSTLWPYVELWIIIIYLWTVVCMRGVRHPTLKRFRKIEQIFSNVTR